MNSNRTERIYREYIIDHGLERGSLLNLLRSKLKDSPTVLYPGCNIHLSPSFYFQHVVYVDKSEFARDFFTENDGVLQFVNNRKKYKTNPYVRFENLDFTSRLPVPDNSFDVLLSLYTEGATSCCARYIKPGGMLISDGHRGDAQEAAKMSDLKLIAVALEHRGKIRVIENGLDEYLVTVPEPFSKRRKGPHNQRSRKADYYFFQRRYF